MAQGKLEVVIKVRQAWWLRAYLFGVTIVSMATGLDPDWNRVLYWTERGIKLEVIK